MVSAQLMDTLIRVCPSVHSAGAERCIWWLPTPARESNLSRLQWEYIQMETNHGFFGIVKLGVKIGTNKENNDNKKVTSGQIMYTHRY